MNNNWLKETLQAIYTLKLRSSDAGKSEKYTTKLKAWVGARRMLHRKKFKTLVSNLAKKILSYNPMLL